MKRSPAAVFKETELARQRAVVRDLIEQIGWSEPLVELKPLPETPHRLLVDNVIPFPCTGERGRDL